MSSPFSVQLQALLEHLPFPLDAVDRANAAFQAWHAQDDPQAKETVEVWTYCYVFRYFAVKYAQGNIHPPSDFDEITGTVFRRAIENQHTVENPDRYASWVSVVCRNAFLNYTRKKEVVQSIHDEHAPTLVAEDDRAHHDASFLRQALRAAIERLPNYLQEVARLRFLRGYSYQEIAEETGRGKATVRTYRRRAVQRLSEDPALAPFLDEFHGGS